MAGYNQRGAGNVPPAVYDAAIQECAVLPDSPTGQSFNARRDIASLMASTAGALNAVRRKDISEDTTVDSAGSMLREAKNIYQAATEKQRRDAEMARQRRLASYHTSASTPPTESFREQRIANMPYIEQPASRAVVYPPEVTAPSVHIDLGSKVEDSVKELKQSINQLNSNISLLYNKISELVTAMGLLQYALSNGSSVADDEVSVEELDWDDATTGKKIELEEIEVEEDYTESDNS